MSQKCTATTAKGTRCRAWAVHSTQPPRCSAHGGSRLPAGAPSAALGARGPTGDRHAQTDGLPADETATGAITDDADAGGAGFYARDPADVTIDQAIAGLVHKMARLDGLFDAHKGANGYLVQLFQVYTLASSRLAHLLRERRALSGEDADELEAIHNSALDHLNAEWGTEL